MRRSRRAAAPGAPTHPRASHSGYGSCRGMESSGPPPTRPRTFPHPSEILGARPPPAQDSRSSHSRDDEVIYWVRKTRKRDQADHFN
jgi:hypothetical protein